MREAPVRRIIVDLGAGFTFDNIIRLIQEPFLKEKLKDPDTILILSGGYTNPAFPYMSEAEYKLKLLVADGLPPEKIFTEDRSIRTTQNLKFSFKLITRLGIKVEEIIITGEEGSKKEALWLAPRYARRYLGYAPKKIEYFGIPYLDSNRRKKKEALFLLIVAAYYFPPLDIALTWYRMLSIRLRSFKLRREIRRIKRR